MSCLNIMKNFSQLLQFSTISKEYFIKKISTCLDYQTIPGEVLEAGSPFTRGSRSDSEAWSQLWEDLAQVTTTVAPDLL